MANAAPNIDLKVEITNRQIFKIALPISLAILVPQINFITNNVFLGHYSQEALATASITGVYYLIFAMIGFGLNSGLQTLIARRAGENRPDEIGRLFGQGIYLSLIVASIGILLTWFIAPVLFHSVLHNSDTASDAVAFIRIRIWGLPFLYIYQMRNALLVGINQSKYLVIGTLSETIANIAFDYLFIFGSFGFPRMGLNGAAVASIIAEFIGMFVIFLVIHRKGISRNFGLFDHFKWDWARAKQILSISLPLVFQLAISLISWEFFYILIEHHGRMALAVSNVMRNIFGLTGCISWAFAATTSAMVSNIIGQGRKEEVLPLIMRITKISVIAATILAVLINIFPRFLLSAFGQDEAFMDAAMPVVRVVTAAMVLIAVSVVWLNAITGTGNSRVTLFIDVVAVIFYSIYVYVVLERMKLSITWGWMSEWLYWIVILSIAFFYMRSGRWKKKTL